MIDLKTAQPVIERDNGVIEPVENISLGESKPLEVKQSISPIGEAVAKGFETFLNMPILGGFSPKQVETALKSPAFDKDRDSAFKWVAMGMPTDLKKIDKAEQSTWAELAYSSPIIKDLQAHIGTGLDIAVSATGGAISPLLGGGKFPEGITKETIKNFPIEVLGDLTEFFTDPASLLMAQAIGYGFKKIPSVLRKLKVSNPDLYKLLTTEIGKSSDALKQAYSTLGLEPTASKTQVNKAYRKMSLENHPDRGGDSGIFKSTQDAYKLITETHESIYDQVVKMYKKSKLGSEKGFARVGKGGKGIPIDKSLIEQAKGMTLDEFVKAQTNVFHGTDADFKNFESKFLGSANGTAPINKTGFSFSSDKGVAETFGKNLIEAKVDIKKPLVIDAKGQDYSIFKDTLNEKLRNVDRTKYDGIVIKNYADAGVYGEPKISDHYIPFSESQIKTKAQLTDIWNKAQLSPKEGGDKGKSKKERGFVTSVKEELPALKVAGQYIPRDTDTLSIKARNLVKDDIVTAEKKALGTDDEAIAVGAELLKYYSAEAAKSKGAVKDSLYEKASELGNDMAKRLTELGRSVQAASILARLTPEGQVRFAARSIQKFNEEVAKTKGGPLGLRKAIPELTPEQTKKILDGMALIEKMPEGEQKAIMFKEIQDMITDLVPTPLIDKIMTVWKAGLLTGIKTSGVNIFSNISHAISETVKDIPATLVDITVSKITGKRSVAFTPKGILKGSKEGAEKGWRFLKTGYDERNVLGKYDYKRVNMGSSKIAKGLQKYEETIFGILGAEDQPFYYGAKMRSLYEQAKVEAINKGLKGKEATAFIDNLVMNPTDEMAVNALTDATTAVYQNETILGNVAKKFQQLGAIAEFILPFGRTPSAVATQIINYTPVGAVSTILNNLGKDKFNQRDFSKGLGRALTGTAILGLGAYLYNQKKMNLDRPTTKAEKTLWELEGRSPNTIKIGNKYRQIQVLGPLGNALLIGGHFAKAFSDTGSITAAMAKGAFGSIKSFTEQTFLTSVNRFMDAVNDPEKQAASFIRSFVGSFVPTLAKDIGVSTDKTKRRKRSLTDSIIERIPLLRQILEPQVDVFGRNIDRAENFLESLADPTRPTTEKIDPIAIEMRRLIDLNYKVNLTKLGKYTGYDSLTPEENTTMWKDAGQNSYERINELMSSSNYEVIPDDVKAKRINKFIDDAKDSARINIALEKTEGLQGEDLKSVLIELVEDGVLTSELYRKYQKLR